MIRRFPVTNHIDLADGAILVTHGDILFLDVAPWSREAGHYLKKHRQILDRLGPDGYADFEKTAFGLETDID